MTDVISPLKSYQLTGEDLSKGLDFFEALGVIRQMDNRYVLTKTGEQFFAAIGCGKATFSELCFQLFDFLVKVGKLKCRYSLKDKSYRFTPK
ncbi:MAG: hypothetical protein Sv326_0771 [Candidatus Fermentimicrarchaeum limneticum]|uniref:Uncharacterized protein n=1 Tax=Fermentimicrarchaeum limneticum TaxID=2795018 RepID=A0A7D5XLQ7_FERL1|nr:MAG: hypothetical protein Sv326_0771 [Candidatus Fermentimicrarchaeum limneticum]